MYSMAMKAFSIGFANVVNGANVWMVKRLSGFGLEPEAFQGLEVMGLRATKRSGRASSAL
jgi:hypothetical protein